MNEHDFRPFDTLLDPTESLALLRATTDGADDGEIFVERRASESLLLDDGRVKSASFNAAEGFGLRAVRGEVTGYAHSTHLTMDALRRRRTTASAASPPSIRVRPAGSGTTGTGSTGSPGPPPPPVTGL